MELEQQSPGLTLLRPLREWQIWIVVAVMVISLLLSGCGGKVVDYPTDLGDPSLYKEMYNKVTHENEALQRKLDSAIRENSTLKARNASLKAKASASEVLSEREQALDERQSTLAEREEQLKQDREKLEDEKAQFGDKAYQEGIKAGLLKKAEEQIQDLKRDLENTRGQLRFSTIGNIVLFFSALALLVYIFLDKYGILTAMRQEGFSPRVKIIDISSLPFQNKPSNTGAIEQVKDSDTKALPSENGSRSNNDQAADGQSPA